MSDVSDRVDASEAKVASLESKRPPFQVGDVVHLNGQAIVNNRPMHLTVKAIGKTATVCWFDREGVLCEADLPVEALRKAK